MAIVGQLVAQNSFLRRRESSDSRRGGSLWHQIKASVEKVGYLVESHATGRGAR